MCSAQRFRKRGQLGSDAAHGDSPADHDFREVSLATLDSIALAHVEALSTGAGLQCDAAACLSLMSLLNIAVLHRIRGSQLQEHDAGSSGEDSDDEDQSEEERAEGMPRAKRRGLSGAKQHRRGVNRRLCQQVLRCSICRV